MICAGLIDRAIDAWEQERVRSTIKNSVAALALVLDEAVRDGLIAATRLVIGHAGGPWAAPPSSPNGLARGTWPCPTSPPSSAW